MFAKMMMLAAAMLSANAAMAEANKPEAYSQLTAVPLQPGKAPRLVHGVSDLSASEGRHQERLPLQLNGAIKKIEKVKYAPGRLEKAPAPKREARAKAAKPAAKGKLVKKVSAVHAVHASRPQPAKAAPAQFSLRAEAAAAKKLARKIRHNTHPVGFEENLPMPKPSATARDNPDSL